MEEITRISPAEVKKLIDQKSDLVVLDVRSQSSYDSSPIKIKGARRIPLDELTARAGELPRDKLIVTY